MDKVLFSHSSDDWTTPKDIYNAFMDQGFFDPCPIKGTRGLIGPWPKKVFCNPPYSNIEGFVDKYIFEWRSGHCIECWFLVPSRTDTKWFAKALCYCSEIIFISGRLSFGDCGKPAPFPSILMRLSYDEYGRTNILTMPKCHIRAHLEYLM